MSDQQIGNMGNGSTPINPPPDRPDIEARLARVETRIEYLATREDVQTVRTEVEGVRTAVQGVEGKIEGLKNWALMRIIAIICAIGGLVIAALKFLQ